MPLPNVSPTPPPPQQGSDDEIQKVLALVGEAPQSVVDPNQGKPLTEEETQALSKKYHKAQAEGQVHSTIGPDQSPITTEAAQNPIADAGQALADVGKGIVGGVQKADIEASKFYVEHTPGVKQAVEYADEIRASKGQESTVQSLDQLKPVEAQTPAGQMASSIAEFATSMAGGSRFMAFAKPTTVVGKIGVFAVKGGVAQAEGFDPAEDRLSNMVQNLVETHPSLANPVSEYLAAKPDDTEAEGRLKNFLEGATVSAAADTLLAGLKGLKKIQWAKADGGDEAGAKAAAEVADELDAHQPEPVTDTAPPEASPTSAQPEASTTADTAPVEPKPTEAAPVPIEPPKAPVFEDNASYYHGTNRAFKQFEAETAAGVKQLDRYGRPLKNGGFYFTHDKNAAQLTANGKAMEIIPYKWVEEHVDEIGDLSPEKQVDHLIAALSKQESKGKGVYAFDENKGWERLQGDNLKSHLLDALNETGDYKQTILAKESELPRVVEAKISGKTLDLSKPGSIPEDLKKVAPELHGMHDSWAPYNFHEKSAALLKYAKEHGYGKVILPESYETGARNADGEFISFLAHPDNIHIVGPDGNLIAPVAKEAPVPKPVEPTPAAPPKAPEVPPPTPEAIAQSDADSIIKELTDQNDFPVDRQTGLLNHQYIDGPGSMRQVLELTAEKVAPVVEKKAGGVQTWKETQNLAESFDASPEELWANLKRISKDADKQAAMVYAAREQMNGLATAIFHEARALDNGVRTDRGGINAMVQKLADMEQTLFPIRRAQARGTRQWGLSADMAISSQQLKGIIASGGDSAAIAKILSPPSWAKASLDAYTEFWINSILSGPKTHIVNITSNLLQAGLRPIEKMAGGQFAAGFDSYVGMAQGFKDSVSMAAKAFRAEESILDPHLSKVENGNKAISAARFGLSDTSPMGRITNTIGTIVRLPTRMLVSADEFFKQLNYRANVYSMATREGMQKGLTDDALASYIGDRISQAFDKTGAGIDEAALHEARLSTFTEDLTQGSFADTLTTSIQAKHPWARLLVPFVRTPTNIIKEAAWHTPGLNLAFKSYRAELAAGGQRAAAARGMWVTGGALWGSAIGLCLTGNISGRGPADPGVRAAKMETGWRPYSVKVGNNWVDYSRFDPMATTLGLAADFAEASGYLGEQDKQSIGTAMGVAMARMIESKTYFQGMAQVIEAMDQTQKDGPQKFQYWLQQRVASNVPTGLKQVAGLIPGQNDDIMREVRSVMDAVYARTPGLSDKLPPKRNLFGEPIHYPAGFGPDSISPFAYSTELHDNVKDELARFGYAFNPPSKKLGAKGTIDLTKYQNANGTQDAYDRLLELHSIERKGRYTMKEKLDNLINSDRYQALPQAAPSDYTSARLQKVQEVRGEYLEACMKRLRKEYPNLDQDLKTDEHNKNQALKHSPSALDSLRPLLGQ